MAVRPSPSLATAAAAVAALTLGAVGCSSGSTDDYCAEATDVAADNPAGVFAAWDPADPAASGDELQRAARQLQGLADVAPAEIDADIGLIAETAEDLAGVLTELTGDELTTALQERAADFVEADEASRRVTDFTRSQCGVDLEAPAPPPTTTTAPPPPPPG